MKWIYVVPHNNARDNDKVFINADSIKSIALVGLVLFLEGPGGQIQLPHGTKSEDARRFLYTLVNCLSQWRDGHVLTLDIDSLSCVFGAGEANLRQL